MQTVVVTGFQTTWKPVQLSLNANIAAGSTANMFTITVGGEYPFLNALVVPADFQSKIERTE
jgi:hypothetical protein